MKKSLLLVSVFILLSLLLVSCDVSNIKEFWNEITGKETALTPSEGLSFRLNEDGSSYSLFNIGICEDEHIVIPSTYNGLPVTKISFAALSASFNVKIITIPDSVTTIEGSAFNHCYSLITINIPASVTSIPSGFLEDCSSLTNIEVDKNNPNYMSIDGNLYSKDGKTLIRYALGKKETSFVIPDFVTTVGLGAFEDCVNLEYIEMSDSVTSLGSQAFSWCTSLKTVKLSNSLEEIPGLAFSYCKSLTEIVIPESVKIIGKTAFENCESITEIKLPDAVTEIRDSAFVHCKSLANINIPSAVTYIGANAFLGCSALTKIVIPSSVNRVGMNAFKYCRSITIYCEANSSGSNWHTYWNREGAPVVWGYTVE